MTAASPLIMTRARRRQVAPPDLKLTSASSSPAFGVTEVKSDAAPARDIRALVARNVILARRALGVTQEDLAARSGVSRATIAQLESGTNDCRLSTLSDLARALSINPAMFFLTTPDLAALSRVVPEETFKRVLDQLPSGEVRHMNALLATGLQRNVYEAGRTGAAAAEAAGYTTAGAIVGASIGSTLQPGIGTAVGALFGAMWADPSGKSIEVSDGAGI
jgi:transcriptional regulator with XRE-family HTH domain